jgi:hypothetical protein
MKPLPDTEHALVLRTAPSVLVIDRLALSDPQHPILVVGGPAA